MKPMFVLNTDLNKLSLWFGANKLLLNLTKKKKIYGIYIKSKCISVNMQLNFNKWLNLDHVKEKAGTAEKKW